MFFIPGPIISLLTFPGVIVHELAHQLFCWVCRVAVLDVCYIRFGNPAGYVVHEAPRRGVDTLLIGTGPFLVNTLLGALIALPAVIPAFTFGAGTPLDYALIWLGVSIAMHAFPSIQDAKGMWRVVRDPQAHPLTRAAALPLVALVGLGAIGSVVWLDVIYGFAVVRLLPEWLIGMRS